ncbi:hypothetical protein C1646_776583 [Rhizophagus diaphanus]|nr:hypothetical protein C1646_776583 [Rhizophagus diaphanus] [Rhizophagus sp. MUCL 43196]
MGHNINGIGPDDFKLNILIDYYANKRADIVGIVETNKDRKYGKFWNKQTQNISHSGLTKTTRSRDPESSVTTQELHTYNRHRIHATI